MKNVHRKNRDDHNLILGDLAEAVLRQNTRDGTTQELLLLLRKDDNFLRNVLLEYGPGLEGKANKVSC